VASVTAPHVDQLLGVDHRRARVQRHGAAGVAGAAAARDDGQAQGDAVAHQRRHFGLGIGRQHDEGIFDAPVGGVGHMRDAGQAVEADVVAAGVAGQGLERPGAHGAGVVEPALEVAHRVLGRRQEARHALVSVAPLVDFAQAMAQGLDQRFAPFAVAQQVVFQVGIAPHHPDVAQHLVKHARRAAGDALRAQLGQRRPSRGAEQANDDLAVGKRGVVVGDFAQSGGHAVRRRSKRALL
jgi:hypothetical protein